MDSVVATPLGQRSCENVDAFAATPLRQRSRANEDASVDVNSQNDNIALRHGVASPLRLCHNESCLSVPWCCRETADNGVVAASAAVR